MCQTATLIITLSQIREFPSLTTTEQKYSLWGTTQNRSILQKLYFNLVQLGIDPETSSSSAQNAIRWATMIAIISLRSPQNKTRLYVFFL